MHDIKWIIDNQDAFLTAMKNRKYDLDLKSLLSLNDRRKSLQQRFDELRSLQNQKSKEIGMAKKQGGDVSAIMTEMEKVAAEVKDLSAQQTAAEEDLQNFLMTIPNVPNASVPIGTDESANQKIREWGEKRSFAFKPQEHWELGEKSGMLDFERGAKIAGARFVLYRGKLAKLERALIQFMLDQHTQKNGYEEVIPPYLVNAESLRGTGQLPKFEGDLFKTNAEYYLIPTAEVPVTNIFRGEKLEKSSLPYKFCAFTPCFRSEAGAYGKDVKGLIRQHQFHKVELVKLTAPETSYEELEAMTRDAEGILQALKLPYRTMLLCSGDMGFGSAKTYDIEVWLPGQNAYREISSCSNCESFQARRMTTRYKDEQGKMQFVHTLNGSGLAVGRTLIAVMENYQNNDGTITVPDVLRSYMGCDLI